jgi:hypothetical protein
LWRFASVQTELDPPAEELAGSDVVRRQTTATRNAMPSASCTFARFCSSAKR